MNKIKRVLQPKEIKDLLNLLDELSNKFNSVSFELVRKEVEEQVLEQSNEFVKMIQRGIQMRPWLYNACANISGDLAESGKYHLWRGVLNPIGQGQDLIKIFDEFVDELLIMGEIDNVMAERQKQGLRENIRTVG